MTTFKRVGYFGIHRFLSRFVKIAYDIAYVVGDDLILEPFKQAPDVF